MPNVQSEQKQTISSQEIQKTLQTRLSHVWIPIHFWINFINKLRSTDKYNGIFFAGKEELADVLERFLRVAIDESV